MIDALIRHFPSTALLQTVFIVLLVEALFFAVCWHYTHYVPGALLMSVLVASSLCAGLVPVLYRWLKAANERALAERVHDSAAPRRARG